MLVSDFYAAYNHYPGLKQRCWAHLLREVHDLRGWAFIRTMRRCRPGPPKGERRCLLGR